MLYLHMHWQMMTTSLHHATHVMAMHPAKFVASVALVGGMGLGGQARLIELRQPVPTSTGHLVMTAPAAPVLHNGAFAAMGLAKVK